MMFEKVRQLKLSSKLRKLSSQICYILTGLSTKQRKRLTIAVELVANPSIIFMDEPTSGLDARAAAIVMRTVRNTVDTGRTVICTIHQPSIDIFEAFASSHEERGTSHIWWQAWCEFTNHDKLLSGILEKSNNDWHGEPCVFDVRSFGAIGDGESDDTFAFRDAWNAACSFDSGVLLVPSDGVFTLTSTIFSGPCRSGLVFQIDGVMMPPNGPDCWPEKDSKHQWLVFYRVDGRTMQGGGIIEGNGEKWWSLPCKPHRGPNETTLPGPCDSPAMIRFFMSSSVKLKDLTIQNSPEFHVKFEVCNGVHIEDLSIYSPALSPNTDGIHLSNTKDVGIYNSKISNGDDCISIGPGCSNVNINNVSCAHSHGISVGSLGVHGSTACVSNVTVQNTAIVNADNGLRIKTWQGGMGFVHSISFYNVYMENVRNCIMKKNYCRAITSTSSIKQVKKARAVKAVTEKKQAMDLSI